MHNHQPSAPDPAVGPSLLAHRSSVPNRSSVIGPQPAPRSLNARRAMITTRDFSFRMQGSPRYALLGVNLNIRSGEFGVLTDPSGCGKSTLALKKNGDWITKTETDKGRIRLVCPETPANRWVFQLQPLQANP